MSLRIGDRLSVYEIVAPLGAGAMGEVWRARDTRLGREVAVKVLPEHFADDEERLQRFEREAKALASLNHPNVAQIYGVDQVGDTCFLVLELVPGETLAERLARGPLPLAEALDVARQIAEGLEAAHEAGVIHRDLKPANVRITPEGKVKVLDFGLAKPAREGGPGSSTDSVLSTAAGRLLGTPTYMAPEQARGKAIDPRVDIWAFGCVLYECLSGRRAFDGETLTDVFAAVIEREPDWRCLPAGLAPRVRELVERCLRKNPRDRLHSIADARLELVAAQAHGPEPASAAGARRLAPREALAWAIAALGVVALGASALRGPATVAPRGYRFSLPRPPSGGASPQIAPDGRHLVYAASSGLALRALDEAEPRVLAGTAGGQSPFWAPDSRQIGYFAGGALWRVSIAGTPPERLAEVPPGWPVATWSRNGTILVDVTENTEQEGHYALAPGARAFAKIRAFAKDRPLDPDKSWPCFLPDGEHYVFTHPIGQVATLQLGALGSDEVRALVPAASLACYAAGHLLYVRDGVLLAQAFDADALELRGEPRTLLDDVGFFSPTGRASFSVSEEGTLVYRRGNAPSRLQWFDRGGRELETVLGPDLYEDAALSPDGKRLLVSISNPRSGTQDLWLVELERGVPTRLTTSSRSEFNPCWAPDGRRFAFSADWQGPPNVYTFDLADGTPRVLVPFDRQVQSPGSWTADGTQVLYAQNGPDRSADLWSVDVADGQRRALFASPFRKLAPTLSPDGRLLAYLSDESGRSELYLQTTTDARTRLRVSTDGAYGPCWRADGRELFFEGVADDLLASEIDTDAEGHPRTSRPQALFRLPRGSLGDWDVSADGQRILVIVTDAAEARRPDEVVVGWERLLGR